MMKQRVTMNQTMRRVLCHLHQLLVSWPDLEDYESDDHLPEENIFQCLYKSITGMVTIITGMVRNYHHFVNNNNYHNQIQKILSQIHQMITWLLKEDISLSLLAELN